MHTWHLPLAQAPFSRLAIRRSLDRRTPALAPDAPTSTKTAGGETPAQRRLGIPLSSLLDTATHPKCSRSRLFLVTRRAAPRLRAADRTPPSHRTRHRPYDAPPLAGLTNRARTGTIGELHLPPSGPVAQLGARFHGMEEVIGSIPIRSTKSPQSNDRRMVNGNLRQKTGRFDGCFPAAVQSGKCASSQRLFSQS